MSFKAAALRYASTYGWPVFPLIPGTKKPWGRSNGKDDATTDPEQIERWWQRQPNSNIGIATGHGFVVLDVDPRHDGDDTLAELESEYGRLPDTPEVLSGDHGRHLYFAWTGELKGGDLAPGVELKALGQYVVAPPSIHPDTGHAYEWEPLCKPKDVPMAPLPAWIVELSRKAKASTNAPHWAADWLRTPILPGGRRGSDGIPKIVGYLRGHGIDCETAVAICELWDATNPQPLGPDELRKHVEGMYERYGVAPSLEWRLSIKSAAGGGTFEYRAGQVVQS